MYSTRDCTSSIDWQALYARSKFLLQRLLVRGSSRAMQYPLRLDTLLKSYRFYRNIISRAKFIFQQKKAVSKLQLFLLFLRNWIRDWGIISWISWNKDWKYLRFSCDIGNMNTNGLFITNFNRRRIAFAWEKGGLVTMMSPSFESKKSMFLWITWKPRLLKCSPEVVPSP